MFSADRQGYRTTCLMRILSEQAFYAGVGVIKPYSYRNGRLLRGDLAILRNSVVK